MTSSCLYNKNRPLMNVEFDNGKVTEIKEVIKENEHLLPICLQHDLTLESVNKWLLTRTLPEKREGLKEARELFHGFDRQKNMFGLSDQYWFRHKKTETWDKLNYFTNPYNQEQGKIFFEPWAANPEEAIQLAGPDLTTNGVLRKRWVQDENLTSWLLKSGSEKYHQEPLSEVLASLMLRSLNLIPFVEYELVIYGLQFCSKCRNFVTAGTEFVPAIQIYNLKERKGDISIFEHLIDMCREYGIVGAREFLTNMVAADYILCNKDRHLGNFGFIREVENGKILGFAPLFDFGSAYVGFTPKERDSRFFSEQAEECFKRAMRHSEFDELDTEAMEEMVEKYPEISDKHAEAICHQLRVSVRAIEQEKPFRRKTNGIVRD